MRPTTVLIVGDGWQRGTLAATRALSAAGHTVHLAGPNRGHAARSGHSSGWHELPVPAEPGFGDELRRVTAETGAEVAFAGDDEHLLALVRTDPGPGVVVGHPAAAVVDRALDKRSLYATATAAGLLVPAFRSERPTRRSEEWIAKHPVYVAGTEHDHVRLDDLAVLEQRGEIAGPSQHSDDDEPWMFQRVVHGELLALVVLRSRSGGLLYSGAQIAETVYPEPFGVSARARSIPVPEDLVAGVNRLMADLDWWGLAEVQFQVDAEGEAHLIDFNGRFFGSMALTTSEATGLPAAWVAVALGQEVDAKELTPPEDARYQWLEGDLRRAMASDRPVAEVATTLLAAPRSVHSVSSWRDARPALIHAGALAWRAVRGGGRRVSRSRR